MGYADASVVLDPLTAR